MASRLVELQYFTFRSYTWKHCFILSLHFHKYNTEHIFAIIDALSGLNAFLAEKAELS